MAAGALIAAGGGAAFAAAQPVATISGNVVSTVATQSTTGVTITATSNYYVGTQLVAIQKTAQVDQNGAYRLDLDYATDYNLSVGEWSGVSYNLGQAVAPAVTGQTTTCNATVVPSTPASNWPVYKPSTFACSAPALFNLPFAADTSLASDNQAAAGVVTLDQPTYATGGSVSVSLAALSGDPLQSWVGKDVVAFIYSTPQALSSAPLTVAANGTINVSIPTNLAAGAHKIAVYDTFGNLIGWSALQVTAPAATVGGAAGAATTTTTAAAVLPETGANGTWALLLTALVLVGLGAGAVTYRTRRARGAGAPSSIA